MALLINELELACELAHNEIVKTFVGADKKFDCEDELFEIFDGGDKTYIDEIQDVFNDLYDMYSEIILTCKEENNMSTINKTIVAFHVGRGGRFNNQGFTKFIGDKNINEFTDKLFDAFENEQEVCKKIEGKPKLTALFDVIRENEDPKDIEFFKIHGLDLGKKVYVDSNRNKVGLDVENDGTGTIDIDGEYDTTYAKYLKDCSEQELLLIATSKTWNAIPLVEEFFNEFTDLVFDWDKFDGDYPILVLDYFNLENLDVTDYYNNVFNDEDDEC